MSQGTTPDNPQTKGTWQRPPNAVTPAKPTPAASPGWRKPTLPADMTAAPKTPGAWHLPPTDKTDTAVPAVKRPTSSAPRPEDALFAAPSAEPVAPVKPSAPIRPEDFELASQPAPTSEDSQTELPSSSSLLDLDAQDSAATPALDVAEEDDDDGVSMSELITLSSLVEEKQPQPAAASPSVPDPAEYARQQLAALSNAGAVQPSSAFPVSASAGGLSAADYAKQQLEQLSGGTSATPVLGVSPAAANTTDLTRRFREAEAQIRTIRSRFQAGQISRDDMQAQMRQQMVLDDNRVWWMMGVESDTWYRFDNGNWVVATPPGFEAAGALPSLGSLISPSAGGFGAGSSPSPFAPSSGAASYQTGSSSGWETGGYTPTQEMPLPQAVPVSDPNATIVGTVGAYLSPEQSFATSTVPTFGAGPTVVNPAMQGNYAPANPYNPAVPTTPVATYNPPTASSFDDTPSYEQVAAEERQRTVSRVMIAIAVAVGLVLLGIAMFAGWILISYNSIAGQYSKDIAGLANYVPAFQTAKILDANGNVIVSLNSQEGGARTTVPLGKISPFMIHAVISLEDERFFENPGWDWISIIRAVTQNIGAGEVQSGASTITQQIAEQLILKTPTTSAELKTREVIIASEIAKQYSKEKILELYLNQVYFGNQTYGVEAASEFYFNHSAEDLNLPEAALLASMIASPVAFNPVRQSSEDLATYSARRETTLNRMRGVISAMKTVGCLPIPGAPVGGFCVTDAAVRSAAAQEAIVESAEYKPLEVTFKYPHFIQFVQALVEQSYGSGEMFRRGFVIKTTLNPTLQSYAEDALKAQITAISTTGVNTGSVMVTDPRTGAIRAMVGSPNFNDASIDGQVNAALTFQQPGSAIKPIVYTAALEGADKDGNGTVEYLTPASILWDVPTTFTGGYTPANFDNRFWGPLGLRYALQNSRNIPAIKAYEFIGDAKFKDVAGRMGLNFLPEAQFNLTTAIGSTDIRLYDMMVAYGVLSNNGVRTPLYAIESIVDSVGQVVPLPERAQAAQVIQPQIAYLMQNILSDDNARATEFGLGGPLTISGLPTSGYVAAKTGTTNQTRDLWTMGFTRNVVVGIWLGRNDNQPTFVQGGGYNVVAPLWNRIMSTALTGSRPEAFIPPSDGTVVQMQICPDTGTQPTSNCPSLRTELFLQSQPPPSADQAFVRSVEVDTWTGLLANASCPDNRLAQVYVNIADQAAVAWLKSAAGQQTAAKLGLNVATLEAIPTSECSINTELPIARILTPTEGQAVSGVVQVSGAASAASFNRFQLEVAQVSNPTAFQLVFGPVTTPQTSGPLGSWNTTTVPNGQYILRLAMYSTTGGYLYRTATINVVNTLPTPIPTAAFIQPTFDPFSGVPTFDPFAVATPLPFMEVTVGP